MSNTEKTLHLAFRGRIIDHLGIQMYQSPVAAVAELISNSWDADAERVDIILPDESGEAAELIVKDDGIGMTFEECQNRFLNIGWCRRGGKPNEHTEGKNRPVLGRKGIGKFAGFGIASVIRIETISKKTGEKTIFEMDINMLRSDSYVDATGSEIEVLDYLEPLEERKNDHGTSVILKSLSIGRRISRDHFSRSMARRFLLHQRSQDFKVLVDDQVLPEESFEGVEYIFPRDYDPAKKPNGLNEVNGWGIEKLTNNREIKWRVFFYSEPIEEEELRGISVFSKGKISQIPFFFNLTGGLSGQHGQEYLSGQIEADYIDELTEDIIATERQRINWTHVETIPLEQWGQDLIKSLLRIWRDRRGEKRRLQIEAKVATFSQRLEKLPKYEQRTIKRALTSLGAISTLSDGQFQTLGIAILQAWEQGRLRDLINDLANNSDVTTEWLLSALTEADVLVALNLAEAVRTKLEAIRGLQSLVEKGELENSIRDLIAEKPYLLDPKWETFKKETSVKRFMDEAAKVSGLAETDEDGQRKRIDLALRSHEHLLIVEFMRPGKKADWDHLSRCRRYVHHIREKIKVETALGIEKVTGLIVADRLDNDPTIKAEILDLDRIHIHAYTWKSLLNQAEGTWKDFLAILGSRSPSDQRLQELQEHDKGPDAR